MGRGEGRFNLFFPLSSNKTFGFDMNCILGQIFTCLYIYIQSFDILYDAFACIKMLQECDNLQMQNICVCPLNI